MEVLFEGQLERCNLSGAREWKRGYGVLRKHPGSGNTVLEFYKDSHWQRNEPKAICNLLTDYEVSFAVSSNKKRFVFELKTADQSYEMGSSSDGLRQRWVQELNSAKKPFVASEADFQNMIQAFNVVLLNEEYAKRHLDGFVGTCQLLVTDAEVIIVAGGQTKIRWKFSTIRRYKSQTGTFVIEVGRKAHTGEGEYRFDTVNPVELFDILDKAVKDRVRSKGIEIATLPPTKNETALPKLPPFPQHTKKFPPRASSMDDEYSRLDKVKENNTQPKQNSEYDQLFINKERLHKHRNSEPAIQPHFLHTGRQLGVDTPFSNDTEEEAYEDMNASLKDDAKRADRPLPPPRSKGCAINDSEKVKLGKSVSTPLENTYDLPNKDKQKPVLYNVAQGDNDYDSLFNKNLPPPQVQQKQLVQESVYSHLDHNPSNNSNVKKDQTYDLPTRQQKVAHQPSVRKPVTKPKRPAPSPPVRNTNNINDNNNGSASTPVSNPNVMNLSLSAGSTSNLVEQLKRRNQSKNTGEQDALYDVPQDKTTGTSRESADVSVTASTSETPLPGYNIVGELIPGQYQAPDLHDYVSVPESHSTEEGEGIYQVAR